MRYVVRVLVRLCGQWIGGELTHTTTSTVATKDVEIGDGPAYGMFVME